MRSLFRLFVLEFEEYWDFPTLEIVISACVLSLLFYPPNFIESNYKFLVIPLTQNLSILVLIVGVLLSRSLAGSLNKREVITLLSYPIKRWHLLLSKFLVNFVMIYIVSSATLLLNSLLLLSSPLEPVFVVSLVILFIQLLFMCSVTTAISIAVHSEVASILGSILLLYGLEALSTTLKSSFTGISLSQGCMVMFGYLTSWFYHVTTEFEFQEFFLAFSFSAVTSTLLLIITFAYFQRIMQID